MKTADELEKRELLKTLLLDLSKSQEFLKEPKNRVDVYIRLEAIYYICDKDNFRHFYSDIFAVLSLIDGDTTLGSLDILAQNMQTIKDGYVPKNKDENNQSINISKEIVKLYDHTNLDIARINYTKTITNETLSEQVKTRVLVKSLDDKVKEATENAENLSESFKKSQADIQKEYITILGIFASIVLAFTGGLVFSTSVLNNIYKASIYRTVLIVLIIGLVFINMLWLLMDFIRSINKEQKRKFWIIIAVDLLLVALMVGTGISYKYDLFNQELKITQEIVNENELPVK